MNGSITKSRSVSPRRANPQVKAPARRPADDQLLLLPEVADYVRRTENTLRYLRHVGGPDAPPLWRQGRRLVAWKSEVDAWLDAQRDADQQD